MKYGLIPRIAACAAVALMVAGGPAMAEFPEKPITMIVPWTAGGSTDQTARALAAAAAKDLGQPIVIVNKPGASTTLGMSELAAAEPDGYTIGTLSSTTYMAQITGMQVPYDMLESFTFISYYGDNMIGIVTMKDKPWNSLEELVQAGKEKPGEISFGTGGVNTTQHLMAEAVQKTSGAKFTHIPHRGSAESLPALLGGHVDFLSEVSVWAPQAQAGEVKVLAINLPKRSESFPDVPTLTELGYTALRSVQGIIGPAGIPDDVRAKLEAAFRKALGDENFISTMKNLRMEIVDMSGAEFRAMIEGEFKNASELVGAN